MYNIVRLYLAVIEYVAVVTLTRDLELLAVHCLWIFSLLSSLLINMSSFIIARPLVATDPFQGQS